VSQQHAATSAITIIIFFIKSRLNATYTQNNNGFYTTNLLVGRPKLDADVYRVRVTVKLFTTHTAR